MAFGGIITALVTPFDEEGRVDEQAFVDILHHVLEHGSDGVVVAGSTGEAATLSDEEKLRLFELAAAESGEAAVIAGTGTGDTRHSVELTERAGEAGVDGVIVVTPYYVKPNRRGILAHFRAVAAATELPVVVYNIPQRTVTDLPNDLLAELAEIPNVRAVKQARYEDLAAIDGLDLLAGNDDMVAEVLGLGGTGGICVASHLVGTELRRMIDQPEDRGRLHDELQPLFRALTVTSNPIPIKAALEMCGHRVGGLRLPLVEASEEERAVIREALEAQGLLAGAARDAQASAHGG